MAALLAFAAIVQFNDPDPVRWVALYAAAAAVSLAAAIGRRVPPALCAALSVVALGWAAAILAASPRPADYLHMFDAWEMQSIAVEEAREASGLLIAGIWLAGLTLWAAGGRRPPRATARTIRE